MYIWSWPMHMLSVHMKFALAEWVYIWSWAGGMGVHVKFINFCIAWHWRDGCKYDAVLTQCAYLGVHMKLIWRNGCTYAVAIAIFATQMWNSSISTFNKTGLKGHFHHPCRRYHKGSGLFLLVEVGGVDDIAVDLFISRDDGLHRSIHLTRRWPAKT